MGFLKNLVWPLIKASLQVWLSTRALQLSATDTASLLQIMATETTDSAKLAAINNALKIHALNELDKFKP